MQKLKIEHVILPFFNGEENIYYSSHMDESDLKNCNGEGNVSPVHNSLDSLEDNLDGRQFIVL